LKHSLGLLKLTLCLLGTMSAHLALADEVQSLALLGRSHIQEYSLALASSDRQWLRAKGELRLGASAPDAAPFDMTASGADYEGVTADYTQLLHELLQVPITVHRYPDRQAVVAALKRGDIDLLGSSNDYELLDPQLRRAGTYAEDLPVLVTRTDALEEPPADLAAQRIAMLYHYRPVEQVTALYPKAQVDLYPSTLAGLGAVAFGQADAFIGDAITARYQIRNNDLGIVQLSNFTRLPSRSFAFAVRENDTRLAYIVDQAMAAIPVTERMSIEQRWRTAGPSLPGDQRLQLSDAEQAWVSRHPRLRVAMIGSYLPFTFLNEQGQLRGLSADLLARVSLLTGLQFEPLERASVTDLINALTTGSADMIAALTPSAERDASVQFTRPYLNSPQVVVTRQSAKITALADLDGQSVAVVRGSGVAEQLRRTYPRVRVVPVEHVAAALALVDRGAASAAITSLLSARYSMSQQYQQRLTITATLGSSQAQVAFAVPPEAWQLRSILDKALLAISPQDLQNLAQRWHGDTPAQNTFWHRYRETLLIALGLLIGLLLVASAWLMLQRRLLAQLEAARREADAASRAKSTFLATMSHEIRTPMNAILGMLELANQQGQRGVFDRQAIEVAATSANSLLALIGDILDIARIESGEMILAQQRTALLPLLLATAQVFQGLARQKGLHLELQLTPSTECEVLLDPLRLRQILSNLLGNAIKFTEQGRVKLFAEIPPASEGDDCQLRVQIEDTGIGIDPAAQQRLFQPFSQVDDGHKGGTGLGLTISRTLAEMMGGTLHMDSHLGQGTVLSLRLPVTLLEPLTAEPHAVTAAAASHRSLRVLVVDDYAPNRLLLERQLKWLEHAVTCVADGQAGLAAWRAEGFDAVITDCHMPLMDGYALARAIRQAEIAQGSGHTLILGFTADAQAQAKLRCLDAGMDDCLFKPSGLEALRDALARVGHPRQAMQERAMQPHELWRPASLESLAGGDKTIIRALLEELARSLAADLAELAMLRQSLDSTGLRDLAHRIKGGAQIVHAHPLLDCCHALEEALPGSETHLLGPMEQLDAALQALAQAIQDYLAHL
jgi:two-component system sensor histidine kinase EvgS